MSVTTKNFIKLGRLFCSSRQLLQGTSASRNIFLSKASSTAADANNDIHIDIVKDGKRLSGPEFYESVKAAFGKGDSELNAIPKSAFDVLLKEYDILREESGDYMVADILNLAVDSVKKEDLAAGGKQLNDLHSGIVMTKNVLLKTFAKHGLTLVNPEGEKFDPNIHEAVFQVPAAQTDKPVGHIAHVTKIGYSLKDRPIRAAQVGVVFE